MDSLNPRMPVSEEKKLWEEKIIGYRIYGDNIDECFKFAEIIRTTAPRLGLDLVEVYGEFSNPVYIFRSGDRFNSLAGQLFGFQVCGGYREWRPERRPFLGYEDPDIILTLVSGGNEAGKPILGVEFNDAIPAGNNAWQRFPRIAHSAELGTPFLYVIPVCDAEVLEGRLKSIRHPNTVFNIAQLVLMDRYGCPSLTIYDESPWYQEGLRRGLASERVTGVDGKKRVGEYSLVEALLSGITAMESSVGKTRMALLSMKEQLFKECMEEMMFQISYFVDTDFTMLKGHPVVKSENRQEVIDMYWGRIMDRGEVASVYRFYEWEPSLIKAQGLDFGKALSTDSIFKNKVVPQLKLSRSCRKADLVGFAKKWGIGVPEGGSKAELWELVKNNYRRPVSFKKPNNEAAIIFNVEVLADIVEESYPVISKEVVKRIRRSERPLLLLPIAGYVEDSGGVIAFSRPDKGLVGLIGTLFGHTSSFGEIVVIMYHQEIPRNWKGELEKAVKEIQGEDISAPPNNLWREVSKIATIVIIDHSQETWMRK